MYKIKNVQNKRTDSQQRKHETNKNKINSLVYK